MKKIIFSVVALLCAAALFFVPEGIPTGSVREDGLYFGPLKTLQLQKAFQANHYNMLDHLEKKQPVPRLFVERVPSDFNRSKFDQVRPALFTEMMLPVILKANQTVLAERAPIEKLKQKYEAEEEFSVDDLNVLETAAQKYGVDFTPNDFSRFFNNLLPFIDAVPPSLLLAMAAEDSGFATSRYARDYNAVYHQRDWNGNGAVPDEPVKEGEDYRIKTFPHLYEAVLSQIEYLNTNGYFENFRMARDRYRRTDNLMRGYSVANFFVLFPNRAFKYPDILKHLIEQYGWTPLDSAVLSN